VKNGLFVGTVAAILVLAAGTIVLTAQAAQPATIIAGDAATRKTLVVSVLPCDPYSPEYTTIRAYVQAIRNQDPIPDVRSTSS